MILILGSALITIGENIKGFGIKQTQKKINKLDKREHLMS